MANSYVISTIFQIIDEATEPVKRIGRAFGGLSETMSILSKKAAETGASIKKIGEGMTDVGKELSMKLTLPITGVAGYAIKAAADMETLQVAFETMLGSSEAAGKMVDQLNKFAAATPFEIKEISNAARSLIAAGVAPDKITEKLQFLGDIAATAQIPLEGIVYVYDKMKNKGRATLEELMPLAERGIPIYDALAKATGKTKEEIMKLASNGQISFQMVENELRKMTEKGGTYFEGMIKQGKTFNGLMSTFMDTVRMSAATLGNFLIEQFNLKEGLTELTTWIDNIRVSMQTWIEEHPTLFKWVVGIAGAIAILGPTLVAVGAGISLIGMAISGLSVLLNPYVLVVVAIAAVAFLIINYWSKLKQFFIDLWNNIVRTIIAAMVMISFPITYPVWFIVKYWSSLVKFFTWLWNEIITIAKVVGAVLYQSFVQPWIDLWDFVKTVFTKIKDIFIDFMSLIGDKLYDILLEPFVDLYNLIADTFNKIRDWLGIFDKTVKVKVTEKKKIDDLKKENAKDKTALDTGTLGKGGKVEDLYINSPVARANRDIRATLSEASYIASVFQEAKKEEEPYIRIVLEAPDGFTAKVKEMNTRNIKFELKYNTGLINPAFAG